MEKLLNLWFTVIIFVSFFTYVIIYLLLTQSTKTED